MSAEIADIATFGELAVGDRFKLADKTSLGADILFEKMKVNRLYCNAFSVPGKGQWAFAPHVAVTRQPKDKA